MKTETRTVLLIALALVMVYIILFPQRLALEPSVSVEWSQAADTIATLPALDAKDKTIGLIQPDATLFVEEGGRRVSWLAAAEALSLGPGLLARYQSAVKGIDIVTRTGDPVARIPGQAAPWFSGKDLAVLSFGGNTLQVYTHSGELRWRLESPDLITGYCATDKGESFVSFAGGTISWVDSQGLELARYRPGHGSISAIYAMLWIESRQILAAVADLDPQQLILLNPRHPKGGKYSFAVQETITLTNESRGQLLMKLLIGDAALVIEQAESLGVLLLDDPLRAIVPLGGQLRQVTGLDDARMLVCLVEGRQGNQLIGMKPDGRLIFRQVVSASWNDLVQDSRGRLVVDSSVGVQSLHFSAR